MKRAAMDRLCRRLIPLKPTRLTAKAAAGGAPEGAAGSGVMRGVPTEGSRRRGPSLDAAPQFFQFRFLVLGEGAFLLQRHEGNVLLDHPT